MVSVVLVNLLPTIFVHVFARFAPVSNSSV
jgi:hypothetical protein